MLGDEAEPVAEDADGVPVHDRHLVAEWVKDVEEHAAGHVELVFGVAAVLVPENEGAQGAEKHGHQGYLFPNSTPNHQPSSLNGEPIVSQEEAGGETRHSRT